MQPEAPGEPSRTISAAEASDLAGIRFTEGDVRFIQGMISHHAQALEMTALLDGRTASDAMRQMARRIELSQEDEIEIMQDWLRERGQAVPAIDAHHAEGGRRCRGCSRPRRWRASPKRRERVRPAVPRLISKHQPRRPQPWSRTCCASAARDSQLFAFTTERHVGLDGGDRPHGRDARRALPRRAGPAGAARVRLRRRRRGVVEHGARGDAAEARGLLRSPQPGGAA